jgi:hypothetical protein
LSQREPSASRQVPGGAPSLCPASTSWRALRGDTAERRVGVRACPAAHRPRSRSRLTREPSASRLVILEAPPHARRAKHSREALRGGPAVRRE